MIFILIAIIFAVVSAIIAKNKNRSAVVWFFLGLFFSFFAFILILVLPKSENKQDTLKSANEPDDFFKNKKSYYYKIKVNNKTNDWNNIRKSIFDFLEEDYQIKRNDTEEILFKINQYSYIKVSKILIDYKMFYTVNSIKCGKIDFYNDLEIVVTKVIDNESMQNNSNQNDDIDKLVNLSELLEKGHLTREEFEIQKEKILDT